MTVRLFGALSLAFALFAGLSPASAADFFNTTDQSHVYCPRGATLYSWVLGYWCEDSTISGVHPIDCKSGPGMAPGTWNNGSATPDQLCRASASVPSVQTTN
jgi:hypothetical protein